MEAVTAVCRALIEGHVPFGILTRRNLADLLRWRVLVLPWVLVLDEQEIAALRAYVQNGGALYVSGPGLRRGPGGALRPDFALADVLGVSWRGETKERFTYAAPTAEGLGLFGDWTPAYPMGVAASMTIAQAAADARVLATVTLPYTDPDDPLHFSSTHNNPPGIATSHPAVVHHRYGRGQALWTAGPLETADNSPEALCPLLELLCGSSTVTTNAPKVVEITVFLQQERSRFVVSLVNFPRELPAVPADGITVTLRVGSAKVKAVRMLPGGKKISHTASGGAVSFEVPRLEVFAMLSVEIG
jgi:hypothetical protein